MIAIKFCVDFTVFQAKTLGKGLARKGSFEIDVYMDCFEGFFSFIAHLSLVWLSTFFSVI